LLQALHVKIHNSAVGGSLRRCVVNGRRSWSHCNPAIAGVDTLSIPSQMPISMQRMAPVRTRARLAELP